MENSIIETNAVVISDAVNDVVCVHNNTIIEVTEVSHLSLSIWLESNQLTTRLFEMIPRTLLQFFFQTLYQGCQWSGICLSAFLKRGVMGASFTCDSDYNGSLIIWIISEKGKDEKVLPFTL